MNEHTPGPWKVDIETGEICSPGPVVLGTIYGADDFPCNETDISEECKANARLIAAAPDMLQALRKALESVCSLKCPSVWKTGQLQPHCDECKHINDIIQKATGQDAANEMAVR